VIAREAIVADPRVLQADASAREAAELLTHPHVRSVLVVDRERLFGCITTDSIVAAVARGVDTRAATAAEVCSGAVTTIAPDAPREDASA
jgi:predicted transcriptional regulator